MKVIKQSNQEIIKHLGGLQYRTKGRTYRLNKFCLKQDIEDGILLHNCITGAEVMIRPFEFMNIYTTNPCDYAEFLLANYFLVPEDYDEDEIVEIIRKKQELPIPSNYLDHPYKFIILTTTRCNARCFYCYEMQSKGKTHMSYETAEKVAEYIMDVAPKNQQIELGWFGGEPLYNMDVIEIICSRLASAGIKFKSNIISNCYLFDEKTVRKAKYDWNLTNVQVTFDGTEQTYNKIKDYIYKDSDESPYYKVINNVKNLLKEGISVSARMNCDHHNFENLKELIVELNEHFKDFGNFQMYVWPLFEIGFTRTSEEKKVLYDSVLELEKMLLDMNYPISHQMHDGIKSSHCMVDSGNAVTITPKGDIGLCEHYIDKNFISHIDNPCKKDFDIIKSWRNYVEANEFCKDCPVRPVCLKMHQCPDQVPCEEHQKNYWIEHYKLNLISNFEIAKQNDRNQKNNQCDNKNNCNTPKN